MPPFHISTKNGVIKLLLFKELQKKKKNISHNTEFRRGVFIYLFSFVLL